MGEKSKHYDDIVKWIEKVIDSCNTIKHIDCARKLIDAFYKTKINENDDNVSNIRDNLLLQVNKQINIINNSFR